MTCHFRCGLVPTVAMQSAIRRIANTVRKQSRFVHMTGSTPEVTIFDKIIRGDFPSARVYEDDMVMAFRDINPAAPVHVLLVPKDRDGLDRLSCAEERHKALLGHMMVTVGKVAKAVGLSDYRLIINDGAGAGQTVFHIHMHIIGGAPLKWPPT